MQSKLKWPRPNFLNSIGSVDVQVHPLQVREKPSLNLKAEPNIVMWILFYDETFLPSNNQGHHPTETGLIMGEIDQDYLIQTTTLSSDREIQKFK